MALIKTLNGGIKLKTNKIHGLNTIFLLSVVERFGSAVGYYFNEMVDGLARQEIKRNMKREGK